MDSIKLPDALRPLKEASQWLNFTYELKPNGKKGKPPINARTGRQTSPYSCYLSYGEAVSNIGKPVKYEKSISKKIDGIGFNSKDTGIIFFDLDDVLTDGKLTPEAQDIYNRLNSYTEVSASGHGLTIVTRGEKPIPGQIHGKYFAHGGKLEIVDYKVMTGHVYGSEKPITSPQKAIEYVYQTYIESPQKATETALPDAQENNAPEVAPDGYRDAENMDNETLLDYALMSDSKLYHLWYEDPEDASKADINLCIKLLFWTNGNRERAEEIIRQCPRRTHDDWDAPGHFSGDRTYLDGQMDKAEEFMKEKALEKQTASTQEGKQPEKLPPLVWFSQWQQNPPIIEPEIISGVLRKGEKMIITAPSKAGKTWALVNLAEAIATGGEWFGCKCEKGKVLYINFELTAGVFNDRLTEVQDEAFLDEKETGENIAIENLRGELNNPVKIAERIKARCHEYPFTCVIVDPLYKFLNGDENKSDITTQAAYLLDQIAETGAAVVYAHHFTKGDSSMKDNIDKGSGSGVLARDADAILSMNALEDVPEDENKGTPYRIEFTLRSFPPKDSVNVWYKYPLYDADRTGELKDRDITNPTKKATEKSRRLNLEKWENLLRKAYSNCIINGKEKTASDGEKGITTTDLLNECAHCGMETSRDTLIAKLNTLKYTEHKTKAANTPSIWVWPTNENAGESV